MSQTYTNDALGVRFLTVKTPLTPLMTVIMTGPEANPADRFGRQQIEGI